MLLDAPPIYDLSDPNRDPAERIKRLLATYLDDTPEAGAVEPVGAAKALVGSFARLAEVVIQRINQVPDKNFLAFLELLGHELAPPNPARALLSFQLAAGALSDTVAPRGTQAAAPPPEGESEEVVFETDADLVVTRTQLAAVFTRDPDSYKYTDRTTAAAESSEHGFPAFLGVDPIQHFLYLGQSTLYGLPAPKKITLEFKDAPTTTIKVETWLPDVKWSYWNGVEWRSLDTVAPPGNKKPGPGTVTLSSVSDGGVPSIPVSTVGDRTSRWLRGTLGKSLRSMFLASAAPAPDLIQIESVTTSVKICVPRAAAKNGRLFSEVAVVNEQVVDTSKDIYPFGETPKFNDALNLAHSEAFGLPIIGQKTVAELTLSVTLSNPRTSGVDSPIPIVRASNDLRIAWEALGGPQGVELASSTPPPDDNLIESVPAILNGDTLTIGGAKPAGVTVTAENMFRSDSAIQVTQSEETWQGKITGIGPGLHIFCTIFAVGNQVQTMRFLVVFRPGGNARRFEFDNLQAPELTSERQLTITGHVNYTGPSTAGIHNAANGRQTPWTAVNNGNFEIQVALESGRNDLLLRVRDSAGNMVAAQVLLVVRTNEDVDELPRDSTWGLTRSGQVRFQLPASILPATIAGQENAWIRARIVRGDYGTEAEYVQVETPSGDEAQQQSGFTLVPASFRPPSINKIEIAYKYDSGFTPVDFVLSENDLNIADHTGSSPFAPFEPTSDQQPTLYLGFERPGAETGFANRSTSLYFGVVDSLTAVSDDGDSDVVWEYHSLAGWSALEARDETNGFRLPGLVKFLGPADFGSSVEFGRELFWLRARRDTSGSGGSPRLRRILTNTTWARQTVTIRDEILGSSTGAPRQVFRLAQTPIQPGEPGEEGEWIEIREPELSDVDLESLEQQPGNGSVRRVFDDLGRPIENWIRWRHVANLKYVSTNTSRHYELDRRTGEIRFGDGTHGRIPPQGRDNVRAAFYRAGGGPHGNLPAGTIIQLKTTVPYVDGVFNWEPSGGGTDWETLEQLKRRAPTSLRHRNRGVADVDFEDLVLASTREVARARAIAATDHGTAGKVTVIIVPRSPPAPQPVPIRLCHEVEVFLGQRSSPLIDLRVSGPDWLAVNVAAVVVPVSLDATILLRGEILQRINRFLHPLTGGKDGRGWNIGRLPQRSELVALVESTAGVDYVKQLEVSPAGGAPVSSVVYSGSHNITFVGSNLALTNRQIPR